MIYFLTYLKLALYGGAGLHGDNVVDGNGVLVVDDNGVQVVTS